MSLLATKLEPNLFAAGSFVLLVFDDASEWVRIGLMTEDTENNRIDS